MLLVSEETVADKGVCVDSPPSSGHAFPDSTIVAAVPTFVEDDQSHCPDNLKATQASDNVKLGPPMCDTDAQCSFKTPGFVLTIYQPEAWDCDKSFARSFHFDCIRPITFGR